jgi:hypothetical protein
MDLTRGRRPPVLLMPADGPRFAGTCPPIVSPFSPSSARLSESCPAEREDRWACPELVEGCPVWAPLTGLGAHYETNRNSQRGGGRGRRPRREEPTGKPAHRPSCEAFALKRSGTPGRPPGDGGTPAFSRPAQSCRGRLRGTWPSRRRPPALPATSAEWKRLH